MFFDTIVMCTLTALVILVSGVYEAETYGKSLALIGSIEGLPDGAALTGLAFGSLYGVWGKRLVAAALALFAFSTLIAWACYGELCFRYLFEGRFLGFYHFCYLLAIPIGAAAALPVVWGISDLCNGLMSLPNLWALFRLRKKINNFQGQIR